MSHHVIQDAHNYLLLEYMNFTLKVCLELRFRRQSAILNQI
jgi:hypothetical protein